MKPRNKFEMWVVETAKTLPHLTEHQYNEAIRKTSPHIAKSTSKNVFTCMECGHQWQGDDQKHTICPKCGVELLVERDKKKKVKTKEYFSVITKRDNCQIIRMFLLTTLLKKGQSAQRTVHEIFQYWIRPDGKYTIYGLQRRPMSIYIDDWLLNYDMQIRNEHWGHSIEPYAIVGTSSIIPELKKRGFDGHYYNIAPAILFKGLLCNNKIETLWKLKYYRMASQFLNSKKYSLEYYWPSLKVAMRHKYYIYDVSMWCDMIGFLKELGKDVRNPAIICPSRLHQAHDFWHERVNKKREKERQAEERRRAVEEERRFMERSAALEKKYAERMHQYLDLKFESGNIVIMPLQSVREFLDEGKTMHHCVYANRYYEHDDTLILHALIDGVSVATIEIALSTLKVMQCRGKCNSVPEHHDAILSIIENNKHQIAKCKAA